MEIKYDKKTGLVPAIIQDFDTNKVLMLGYMNKEAFQKTLDTKLVTFFSRSKERLWTKGEESGNFLHLIELKNDCDNDTLLVYVKPDGPTCHKGTDTCWEEKNTQEFGFLTTLENTITDRKNNPTKKSYTALLFSQGINRMAQKVGEEAVEVVIEAKDRNDDLFIGECSDLLYHYLVLLQAKGFTLIDVVNCLKDRHEK